MGEITHDATTTISGEIVHKDTDGLAHKELTPAMQKVINQIDKLFGEIQTSSMRAFWHVGRLITEVRDDPDKYLTSEQRAAHVDGEAVITAVFAPVYTAEQIQNAVTVFDRYPSESELNRLLAMRCPDRPRWRLTTSHVQLLSQIADDGQRAAVEEKCAEEAYTARALATELQELRGRPKSKAGRPHESPKGLKQQIHDLLQLQRRFIARSESLWLSENTDNIYDDIANAPPTKLDETVRAAFSEVEQNFSKLSDLVADHVAMCRKVREQVFDKLESQDEDEDEDAKQPNTKVRSHMTR
jgi:hypothetical protein